MNPNSKTPPSVEARAGPGPSLTPSLSASESPSSRQPSSLAKVTFSEAVVLGNSSSRSVSAPNVSAPLPPGSGAPPSVVSAPSESPLPSSAASMHNLCLLGKPWGESIPLPVVISKTRKDWGFVKGQLDYLDLGNGWILFRFANALDLNLVWEGRPWHVSGLNLVLRRWEPFFDPFSATIERIDQWIKITRLPLELWEEEIFRTLLANVGHFIKMDDITLNRSKGKFARVCLNIDISKPLRGSLFIPIPYQSRPLEVPISYEGLHEVCALCGSDAHELEVCPDTPKGPIEVIVEKFGATKLQNDNGSSSHSPPQATGPAEKWITVAPKKRGRSFPPSKRKTMPKIVVAPVSPSVKVIPHSSPSVLPDAQSSPPKETALHLVPPAPEVAAEPFAAVVAPVTALVGGSTLPSSPTALEPAVSGTSRPVSAIPKVFSSTPTSPLEGSDLDDDDVTMYLNLENEDEAPGSSESSKKRRVEEGDVSSPSSSAF